MKVYTGIDAVDIDRIKKSMKKQNFLKSVKFWVFTLPVIH